MLCEIVQRDPLRQVVKLVDRMIVLKIYIRQQSTLLYVQ